MPPAGVGPNFAAFPRSARPCPAPRLKAGPSAPPPPVPPSPGIGPRKGEERAGPGPRGRFPGEGWRDGGMEEAAASGGGKTHACPGPGKDAKEGEKARRELARLWAERARKRPLLRRGEGKASRGRPGSPRQVWGVFSARPPRPCFTGGQSGIPAAASSQEAAPGAPV